MNPTPINAALFERLGLVQSDQWPVIQRRARRIAGRLPLVESVSIDAMLQLGYITPYQAKQLQEGNAESLRVGPYVILDRRESLGWADSFDAYHLDDRRRVYLAVVRAEKDLSDFLFKQLEKKGADTFFCGVDDRAGVWIAVPPCPGESVARWMVRHGRFSPDVVLEVARQMARTLADRKKGVRNLLPSREKGVREKGVRNLLCEAPFGPFRQKIPDTFFSADTLFSAHGDLRVATVFLDREQGVHLLMPGVRAMVRPRESFAETDGPIDMYDGLSPERAAEGTMPDVKSDLFAAGSLWWQMLVGRSPIPGGDGQAKLRAAARGKIDDVRKHAADVPELLARAIDLCTARSRADRPDSFDQLAKMLGESDTHGVRALRRSIRGSRTSVLPIVSAELVSRRVRYQSRAMVAACILVAAVALGLAAQHFFRPPTQQTRRVRLDAPLTTPVNPVQVEPKKIVDPTILPENRAGDGPIVTLPSSPAEDSRVIVLESDTPVAAESLASRLKSGMVVKSPPGKRAQVLIGGSPLSIATSGVRFEGVDFVAAQLSEDSADRVESSDTYHVMIELRGSEASFVGCTFQAERGEKATTWTSVHWIFPDAKKDLASLHNGRIVFENCVFGCGTGTTLHAEVHAAVAVELRNVLHLGVGPMLFLESPPRPDEPWRILADRVTLRESGPFWACRHQSTRTGSVRIEANDSVFAPKGTQPLLLFVGENDPEPIFRKIEWTGRSTLVKKTTPIAAWQDNRGDRQPIDDEQASIEGLVRSQIEFIGPTNDTDTERSSAALSSVLKTWDAPLISDTPPGIDAEKLR